MEDIYPDRAVEVLLDRGERASQRSQRWFVGSGFLIGGRRVLTAAHNVADGTLSVRRVDGAEHDAVALPVPLERDIALLEITEEPFGPGPPPVRFATVDRRFGEVLERCWAVGFPFFKEKRRGPGQAPLRDSVQLIGRIPTASNLVSGRLEFIVANAPRPLTGQARRSQWQGISGAVVFFEHPRIGDVVIGVIVEHHLPEGESSLTVEPLPIGEGSLSAEGLALRDTLPAGEDPSLMVASIRLGSRYELDLQHDAELLSSHRVMFMRPAFQVACAQELFLSELLEAIDDTLAALNTGRLYSRRGNSGGAANLLGEFADASSYRSPEFRATFRALSGRLVQLKRRVLEFERYFRSVNPGYSHHENFYAMFQGFWYDPGRGFWSEEDRGDTPAPNSEVLTSLVDRMQAIDDLRNEMLTQINRLLILCGDAPLELIIPGSREIASSWMRESA